MTAVLFSSIETSGTDTPFAQNDLSYCEILCALVKRIRISNNGAKRCRALVFSELPKTLSVYIEHVLRAMRLVALLKREFLVKSSY